MTEAQRLALASLCRRYNVPFDESHYVPQFDLPEGYLAGWVGGPEHGLVPQEVGNSMTLVRSDRTTIYVGVSPQGEISS
jgi:hypothetical protein